VDSSRRPRSIVVLGSPGGPRGRRWRDAVGGAATAAGAGFASPGARSVGAGRGQDPVSGAVFDFTLEPRRWIDLDTITEVTVAGLRDAGVWARGLRHLDALLATKRTGPVPGVRVELSTAAALRAAPRPGPAALDLAVPVLPRPSGRAEKLALREHLARAWGDRPLLDGGVWVEVTMASTGSLLGPLEPTLDTLEPVLGRDPRGHQEFFPRDDLVVWLRVLRSGHGAVRPRLRLGLVAERPGGTRGAEP